MQNSQTVEIDISKIATLLVACVALIVAFGIISFVDCSYSDLDTCKDMQRRKSFWSRLNYFLNGEEVTLVNVLVGMAAGFIFGFVDNAGLFFGMDALDGVFSKYLPFGTEEKVKSGYGNTFSDVIGSFLSTFIARLVESRTKVVDYPIWSETLGVFVGCLVGIAVPRAILGKPS